MRQTFLQVMAQSEMFGKVGNALTSKMVEGVVEEGQEVKVKSFLKKSILLSFGHRHKNKVERNKRIYFYLL